MKEIILSADSKAKVYLVPDAIANNLHKYCMEFLMEWLPKSPYAQKYRVKLGDIVVGYSFTEIDFIDYLNKWVFPDEQSVCVKELDFYTYELPVEYEKYPEFNF